MHDDLHLRLAYINPSDAVQITRLHLLGMSLIWDCRDQPYVALIHYDAIKWKYFRVTVPLCGESTGDRWIPRTQGQ